MLTAVLTEGNGVFERWEDVPAGRRWTAIRYEHKGKARDGGTLTYYVARTPETAAALAQGRAVFVEAELRAVKDALAPLTDEQVLEWLQNIVEVKSLFTGARIERCRPAIAGDMPLVRARFLGHDGAEIDLTPGEATPLLAAALPAKPADPPALPEGL